MKLPAKTVPAAGGGTIPLRTSKNPVLGVYLHHCGTIASVHKPKGRRKHLHYLICEKCGTDQCAGAEYQEKIAANMQPTIEDLQKIGDMPDELPVTIPEKKQIDASPPQTEQNNLIGLNQTESLAPSAIDTVNELETAKNAVLSQPLTESLTENLTEKAEPIKRLETAKPAVQAEKTTQPDQVSKEKATRIGLFALLGAGVGAILAFR